MKAICDILDEKVTAAIAAVVGDAAVDPQAIIKPSQDDRFGDYQANGVMGLAKRLKQNPRQLAEQVVAKLDVSEMCEKPEIAGPGFINFRLRADWLAVRTAEALADTQRLGVESLANPPRVVVDFSGPNLAKQMHVGHLRSTVIGDVIANVLGFYYGSDEGVTRQNHVGDWGLQFGMLVAYLREWNADAVSKPDEIHIGDMEEFYRAAKQLFDTDEVFKETARQAVVALHNHDSATIEAWNYVVAESRRACQLVYDQLGVALGPEHERGESAYSKQLPEVISALGEAGLIVESDGAQCVFLDGFKAKDGDPLPLIVQKSDGAYLYATTDLAALRYRIEELKADRIIYVTDARQKLHFAMLFACGRSAGWAGENVSLEHVPFGSVLGEDNKPFKTRSGENVKLKALLDEAETRARAVVEQKNPDLSDEQKQQIAKAVGIGAVKYADLSNNLVSDYVFSWSKMLALEGNTAPYMQYAYARVQSILRKGQVDVQELLGKGHAIELIEREELALAKHLLRYGEAVETVARDLRPHLLTNYLFELAQAFSSFYTNCPVLKAAEDSQTSRLLLCCLTARTIQHGLALLGIETIEQM